MQTVSRNCPACGRVIDASGLCRCDPEWISPAEANADKKVSERTAVLLEIKEFLEAQTRKEVLSIGNEKVMSCLGCGSRWLSTELPSHDNKCWPNHVLNRINNVLKEDGV